MRISHFWISVERNTLLLLDENSPRSELFGLWSKKVFSKLTRNGHSQFDLGMEQFGPTQITRQNCFIGHFSCLESRLLWASDHPMKASGHF